MHCAHCGFDNPAGMKFCGECGTPLQRRCPQCGSENPPQFKFCGVCATPLPGPSPAPPALSLSPGPQTPLSYTPPYLAEKIRTASSTLDSERKQVTVLFADTKGSTELIADLDPEEARQLLDPVLERMMAAVHRYEGTVNQVMGDGIMALFGAPIAHEDHALRACYAALAMQAALHLYTEDVRHTHGVEMQIRVGMHSGEVVVRAIANDLHIDYSAVGLTTVLAARMEQLATPGSIRLTLATLRLVEGRVQVQTLGLIPVKGLAEPLEVFELLGARASGQRWQAAAGRGLTRFVGRETESAALALALGRASAGRGQVVATVGEPGVGKSRLVYECVQAHRGQGWQVLEAAAVSYGTATPYLPVIELLKRYGHLDPHDDTRTIRAKMTAQILTLDETLQDTVPPLLALLDALPADSPFWQLEPPQRRQRTLEAFARVLLRESQRQPLLLVWEDLQWIDPETQACLDSLVERLPAARLLLLVTSRPEYQHAWGGTTASTQLRLDPLPPASADAFVQALVGDDASLAPLTPLLLARTEGNPFFLEESVRTLVETGALVGERGAYRLAQALPTIQVPATVHAVLAARIDRLPPEAKQLLQTATVIGHEVPCPLLQAIAERPEEAVQRSLAYLQAAEFLYETQLYPEVIYTFTHALTHEVAYGTLLQARRRVLHGRVVATLEALAPERQAEQVERLAHHALRGELWAKAVPYCQQAGTRAYERAAFRTAVTPFDQALAALAHLPATRDTQALAIDLRLGLFFALGAVDEWGRIPTVVGEAEALARALDDRARLVRVLNVLGILRRYQGEHAGAIAAGQQALALADALGDRALQASAAHWLGTAYLMGDDPRQAAALLRRSVEALAGAVDAPSVNARLRAQAWLLGALGTLGAFAEGRRHGEEALRRVQVDGRGTTLFEVHTFLGGLYILQGDLEAAIRVLDPGLALCRATGHKNYFRQLLRHLGRAYAGTGRLAEGVALLEEALQEGIRLGSWHDRAGLLLWLSEGLLLAGRRAEAEQHARQGLDMARQQQQLRLVALALHQLGAVHAHAAPPEAAPAEACYREALALFERFSMRPNQAHCHLGLGTLYGKINRREEARAELTMAITMYRAMEMTFWLPEAEAALAEVVASK